MSGYGVSGFGTGFLQGFEAMGRNFAERGVIEGERQKQQREDRRLQMEQELERIREERLAKEADSLSRHRNLQSDKLEAELPVVGEMAKAELDDKKTKTEGERITNQLLPEKVNAAIRENNASADLHTSKSTAQNLENNKEAAVQTFNKDLAGAFEKYRLGTATGADFNRARQVVDLAGMENIPQHLDALHEASVNYVAAAQKGDPNADNAFNNPKTLGAINAGLKFAIDKNKGVQLDADGNKMIEGSEVVRLVRNPKDNRLGAVLRVQPAPTPERRKMLEAQLERATPEQAVQIESELRPQAYEQMLTDGRTPVDLGGKALWFSPEDVNRIFTGLQGVGAWQAKNPQLVEEIRSGEMKANLGQYGKGDSGKDLDREIRVREENRKNRREARDLSREQRLQQKEAFNVASRMIDKEYSDAGFYGGESLTGNSAARANAEKQELDRVLRENPSLSGAEAYGKVKERLKGAVPAPAPVQRSGKEPTAKAKEALGMFE